MLPPIAPSEWNRAKARHLLNRAGFGVPRTRIDELAALSPEAAVARMLDYEAIPDSLPAADFIEPPLRYDGLGPMLKELEPDARKMIMQDKRGEERQSIEQLKAWWLMRMQRTARPLEEKMALFWHGHFATSAQKVQMGQYNLALNDTFRAQAVGNFKQLTIAVGQSPAMLHYLDNRRSNKDHPNENWARELMELFTLGKGNYTEQDIKESARAFTGWTIVKHEFAYRMESHDTGAKSFMGRKGNFDGWDIIDIIFDQPAAAAFICAKLWCHFAGTEPSQETVDALAETLRANKYEVKPVLRELFSSKAFYAKDVLGAQIKSPAQFVIQLCEDMEVQDPPYLVLAQTCRALGQDLFYPPNVKGWDGNRAWIDAARLLQRYNVPARIALASVALDHLRDSDAAPDGAPMEASMGMQAGMGAGALAKANKAYQQEFQAALKEKLAALPADERAVKREMYRFGTPAERLAVIQELRLPLPPELQASVLGIFDAMQSETAGECVDALVERFMSAPIAAQQRVVLAQSLGAKSVNDALNPKNVPAPLRMAAVHMLTSMAEYQLC